MNLTVLDNIFWAAGFVGHAALLLVLLTRNRWRQFPVFTCLIAFHALVTIALFLTFRYGTRHTYAVIYWFNVAVDFLLQVALILRSRGSFCVRRGLGSMTLAPRSSLPEQGVRQSRSCSV